VLVTGESGTGKELVARAIHSMSRRNGDFVAVNCGAISPSLMESELFGHERGSFSGAHRRHLGFFERAHQGTLFLDEITEMPLELQVKLLRVLETSQFTRIGAESPQTVNVRIVAATNRLTDGAHSDRQIADGKLRKDLYYRLKVVSFHVPALRDRREDIPLLASHFLSGFVLREGRAKFFADSVVPMLMEYPWPGNIRELRNAIHTAYLLSEDEEIHVSDFPSEVRARDSFDHEPESVGVRLRIGASLSEAERLLILKTLAHVEGNKTRAAEALGISVKTLYNRLHEYGVMDRDE
jgi:DNA-binding NtrC family response regulator